jgi:hypothetical protein
MLNLIFLIVLGMHVGRSQGVGKPDCRVFMNSVNEPELRILLKAYPQHPCKEEIIERLKDLEYSKT